MFDPNAHNILGRNGIGKLRVILRLREDTGIFYMQSHGHGRSSQKVEVITAAVTI